MPVGGTSKPASVTSAPSSRTVRSRQSPPKNVTRAWPAAIVASNVKSSFTDTFAPPIIGMSAWKNTLRLEPFGAGALSSTTMRPRMVDGFWAISCTSLMSLSATVTDAIAGSLPPGVFARSTYSPGVSPETVNLPSGRTVVAAAAHSQLRAHHRRNERAAKRTSLRIERDA